MKKLEAKKLSFQYNKNNKVIDSVDFLFSSPEKGGFVVSLLGPSGSGKTTLLKLMLGVLKPDDGTISLSPEKAVLAYVPQEDVLFEHLSPFENATYFRSATAYRSRYSQQLMEEITEALNMTEVLKRKSGVEKLSGGEKQRLALIRALSINPDILLLDEPCTGLDSEVKHAFLLKLRELASKYNLFVIYVTHHLDEAKLISDKISYLVSTNANNIIDNVYIGDINNFLQVPPSIKAIQMVYFPLSTLLRCDIENNQIELSDVGKNYVLIKEDNIHLNNNSDWEFEVCNIRGLYATLKHSNSNNFLTIPYNWIAEKGMSIKLNLLGEMPIYNQNGIFSKTEKFINKEKY